MISLVCERRSNQGAVARSRDTGVRNIAFVPVLKAKFHQAGDSIAGRWLKTRKVGSVFAYPFGGG
ncbi:hypothetical protein GCM10028811_32220 [Uliginosibacterium sediminicola]